MVLFYTHLKTPGIPWRFGIIRGYKMGTLAQNMLNLNYFLYHVVILLFPHGFEFIKNEFSICLP